MGGKDLMIVFGVWCVRPSNRSSDPKEIEYSVLIGRFEFDGSSFAFDRELPRAIGYGLG